MARMTIRYLPDPDDYYGCVVAEAVSIPLRDVTKRQRSFAKWVTFGCRSFDERVAQLRIVARLVARRT